MKKSLIIILVFLINFVAFSQEAPKMPKYIAKNAANIFYYDSNEVIDKIKVKKDEIGNLTKKSLRVYNNKIKDVSFLNFQKLQDLEMVVNTLGEQASSDRDLAMKLRKQIEETIIPIRDSVKKNEDKLNKSLKDVLSKKQYKKWLKYQKKKKQELLPKPPKSNNNQNQSSMGNRNRSRGGRGRY
ncbi:hypothetical protein H9W90_06910 [Polaribacter pectinis]|uniref:DUF4168 domain-containing protein n=1 Tax=Polaribacter pectinis TaxID=2738844 RepID=A0A7G9LDY3_9FLAO|nr:hypothetical protein [Polaribacter pectinis]QNM86832.1 hypothetical protein H9W90_06910 [Polaribacter pectinis]